MRGKDSNDGVEAEPFAVKDVLDNKQYTSTTDINSSTQVGSFFTG